MNYRIRKLLLYIAGTVVVLLAAGYFIAGPMVRRRVDTALRQLPPSLRVSYSKIDVGILTGSVIIHGLVVKFVPGADPAGLASGEPVHSHLVTIDRVAVSGIRFWKLLSSKKFGARKLQVEGCSADLDQDLLEKDLPFPKVELPFTVAFIDRVEWKDVRITAHKGERKVAFLKGRGEIDSVAAGGEGAGLEAGKGLGIGRAHAGAVWLLAEEIRYTIPEAGQIVRVRNLELDSKKRELRVDTLKILPAVDKLEIGRIKGHQVDCVEAGSEDILISGLDVMALLKHSLIADEISVRENTVFVFRDRRLPLEEGDKPMPVKFLKGLPVSIRVQLVKIGATSFAYEEFPKKGEKTGTLKIVRLKGTISPLINHPEAGDPSYITMKMQGSLMGSGLVDATTRMPLHAGDAYEVEGAFHELDVTTLNNSAENLGRIHLESGKLNRLAFWFRMDDEKATGKIVGEYHDLVVDKLRENSDEKKTDKLKSFFLKKFIIPKDKDRSLPESKRTGKVDSKRDPSRYFSYYLLHSLLVGVKSSFSLGFLLPG
jgi:hypothetical protein